MDERVEQARAIAALLPAVMRQLFAVGDSVASELPLAQLRVCSVLHQGPRAMSALSRELGMSLSALTQIADRLERSHMVDRVAEGPDRRVRYLRLTPRGESLMRQREEMRTRRVAAALEHLSPAARREILAALDTLAAACVKLNRQDVSNATA
jgi:DNA-binding MarR family transcriptional regulator